MQNVGESLDQFEATACYQEKNCIGKARAFVAVCDEFAGVEVEPMEGNRYRVVMEPELYRELAAEARAWIASRPFKQRVAYWLLAPLRLCVRMLS